MSSTLSDVYARLFVHGTILTTETIYAPNLFCYSTARVQYAVRVASLRESFESWCQRHLRYRCQHAPRALCFCNDKRYTGFATRRMHPHACIKEQVRHLSEYLNLNLKPLNMRFASETVILILLSAAVYAHETLDVEIVFLPSWNIEDNAEVPLSFKAFDRSVELQLQRNDKITAPQFQVWKHHEEDAEELAELKKPALCHYLHRDAFSSAAVSLCGQRGVHGLIFFDNVTFEIMPLLTEESSFDETHAKRSSEYSEGPHIVKRAYTSSMYFDNELNDDRPVKFTNLDLAKQLFEQIRRKQVDESLTLELALFFDEAGYNTFYPYFEGNDKEMRDMLLAYVNGVQAIYHHPSLGVPIDISLVRLDIFGKQPKDLPHFGGDRSKLLDSFCKYAMKRNPPEEDDPRHWDMGLYVSGLDFYALENGKKNSATMGLATVGGVCIDQYSCIITELGTTNQFGKPFPSAGFTSVYIAAHEIGHNLGMHHDSSGNACPTNGYIMSPSRGTKGETIWSKCSRDVAERLTFTKSCLKDRARVQTNKQLDHTRYFNLPGRKWNAKKQCEILLRDKDATVAKLDRACEELQCKTPHRSGFYFAGPALDGTYCAPGKECRGGECRNALQSLPSWKPEQSDEWSEWKLGACSSGCISKSKGVKIRRRVCNSDAGCEGLHYDVVLCDDDKLCKKKRRGVAEFASLRCSEFGERLAELDGEGGGLQAPHEPERPWMACAIFCRRKDIASYYTPRVELNDLGLDPYFPDGTWCHAEQGRNYFCRRHHCLPDSFRFEKTLQEDRRYDDAEFGPQNAHSGGLRLDDQVIKYLSLGLDGSPLLTSLPHGSSIGFPPDEDEWIDKDYVELTEPPVDVVPELQYLMKK